MILRIKIQNKVRDNHVKVHNQHVFEDFFPTTSNLEFHIIFEWLHLN